MRNFILLPAVQRALFAGCSLAILLTLNACQNQAVQPKTLLTTQAELGESLFNDPILSINRQQSCATCHNAQHGWADTRKDANGDVRPTSMGADGTSVGERNSPTISYAALTPEFKWASHARFNSQQPNYEGYIGGQFLDGREPDLAGQAGQPPLNPIEMQMVDKQTIVQRLQNNQYYLNAFQALYGPKVFEDVGQAYKRMTQAIAEFEKTRKVSPFDSKYDRVLRGEASFSFKELSGKSLFFSQQFTNCATCHQGQPNGHARETFTNYEYHNIGVPTNAKLNEQLDRAGRHYKEAGLLNNPLVTEPEHLGKFRTPTLRNVAVTGPYMHNGVFKDLATVVEFYDHFLVGSNHQINPETGLKWAEPEVPDTVAERELKDGRKLKPQQVEQMVCFLRTLTDQKFEHLIEENGIHCAD